MSCNNKLLPPISELSALMERCKIHAEIGRMTAENKKVESRNFQKTLHRFRMIIDFFGTGVIDENWPIGSMDFNLEPLPYSQEQITELVIKTF